MQKKKHLSKAVALKYKDGFEAPIITAKGVGKKAEKILEVAKENEIFVQQNDSLVEFLGCEDVGTVIPVETWEVVAKIFSFIIDSKDGVE